MGDLEYALIDDLDSITETAQLESYGMVLGFHLKGG